MAISQPSKEEAGRLISELANSAHREIDAGLKTSQEALDGESYESVDQFLNVVKKSLKQSLDQHIVVLEETRQYRMAIVRELHQIREAVSQVEAHNLKSINQDLAAFAKLCDNPFIQALVKGAISNEPDRTEKTQS